jgi:hypothetical protein
MDPILTAAEQRRDELRQELQKIEEFLVTYRSLARMVWADSLNIGGTQPPSTPADTAVDKVVFEAEREAAAPQAAPPPRVRVTDNPKPALVAAAAVEVIREAGKPLTRRQIHRTLKERGMEIRGADPIKALGTMLWRSGAELLEQVEGKGYWVKGDPLPAEHDPGLSSDAQAFFR